MMEIKLTDKQFEQLQTELIKDVIKRAEASKTSKKKFVDVTIIDYRREKLVMQRQVSICIDCIVSLISADDATDFKTEIITSSNNEINGFRYLCTSSIEEIKQMIKEAENND
ncbi:hypothetical protein [Gilliamella apicola]